MMTNKALKFLYVNIRSLVKAGKLDELRCIIESFGVRIHVIIITETWIKSDDEAQRLKLPNYTHYYNYRKNARGGGVSLFIHNSLKHELLEEQCEDGNHFLWVHIDTFSLDIGAIYKQPAANTDKFLENYNQHLSRRKRVIVFGDLNLNLLTNEKTVKEYKAILRENNIKVLNKITPEYCTRETSSSKTIIDHVCSNLQNNTFQMSIIESSIADHKQIYLELNRPRNEPIQRVQYESINYINLQNDIKNIFHTKLLEDYEELESQLLQTIAKNKTSKTKMLNPPCKEWINKDLITLINKRNQLWHSLNQTPGDEDLRKEFLKQRNLTFVNIQTAKNQYYLKAFANCQKYPLKMWQLINRLSNNKTEMTDLGNIKINTSNGEISDTQEICEYFNRFFATIGTELANKIPQKYHNNLTQTLTHNKPKNNSHELSELKPTSADEVIKLIKNLNSNTSSGLDGISTKSIKCVKDSIAENLANCINKCLNEGHFPNRLKIAKVSPIFKSGNKLDPSNYRPISVLPVMSKIFEKILHKQLYEYLTSIDYLYNKQYGFRPKSNTVSATVDLVTNIRLNIDQKKITLGIFIDLKKAFDTVSHKILLSKLKDIGVTGKAYEVFKSYLTDRSQVVKINNHQSDPQLITCGIPQGSILGPLLFLIYVNNIYKIGLKGDVTLYADDTSLFYSGHSLETVISQAQHDLDLLHIWLQSNLLTINASKTKYVIFCAKNKKIGNHSPLTINGENITKVNNEKYLGLILDSQLTWKPQIEKVRNKINSLTGALKGIVRCLPKQVRYTIYNSLVKSRIDYLIEVWGSATKTNLKKLQVAQNRVIKTLFRYNYLTPTIKIYKETKLFNLAQTYKYNTCIFIRKILTKDIHSQITFTKRIDIYKRMTRRANNLCLRSHRTNYGKKSILYDGAQLYNELPKTIKEAKSLFTFKKLLKSHILKDFHE